MGRKAGGHRLSDRYEEAMYVHVESRRRGVQSALSVTITLAVSLSVCGAEPFETAREAFHASSKGLTSGTGNGRYRRYETAADGTWQLKVDADITTFFSGNKYHVDLAFHRDDVRHHTSTRIIYDGEAVTTTWFSPDIHPVGAHTVIFAPENNGDGTSRPWDADFPWDVSKLPKHVWDPEAVALKSHTQVTRVHQTQEGNIVVETSKLTHARYECDRRYGLNIAKAECIGPRDEHPRREYTLRWKKSPDNLWYVTSFLETFDHVDLGKRVHNVLMYSQFCPNVDVAPIAFTEESLRMPDRCPIVDLRHGREERVYQKGSVGPSVRGPF